ncbi:MAG: MFS transporter [Ramlibacter sp.]
MFDSQTSLFRHQAFVRLWVTRLLGTTASQMLMLAVGWQMYGLTGSAWDLGLVGLFQFTPALLLSLLAGHVADRHNRARIVAACLAAQTGVALLLMTSTQEHWVSRELLLGVSLVLGSIRAFQMSAQQALLPSLVPPGLLARAMALGSVGTQISVIGGPALGGVIFGWGAGAVYATTLGLSGLAVAACLSIGHVHVPPPREPVTVDTVLAGVRFITRSPVLLGAISLDLFAVLLGGATALLPIFAKDILHVGPSGLGLLRSAPAVGALAVGLLLARWPVEQRVGRKLLAAVALFGGCMVVFGLSTSFALSLVALGASGAADMVSVVVRQTLVQLETPDAMRGRVAAVNTIFIGASNQLGEFESGATAALLGPVGSAVLGGLGTIAVALLWLRLFRPLAQRDRLTPRPPPLE